MFLTKEKHFSGKKQALQLAGCFWELTLTVISLSTYAGGVVVFQLFVT